MIPHLPALIFLLPFAAAISMPLVSLVRVTWCRGLTLGVLVSMAVLSFVLCHQVVEYGPFHYPLAGWPPPLGIEWVADGLNGLLLPILASLACIGVWYASPTVVDGKGRVYYYTLVLLLVSGLTGILLAGDLFNIFVFLEVSALSSYALVGLAGGRALISAFRYLILGTLGASFYLLGVGHFYAVTGTLNMADLAERLPSILESKVVITGLIFMLIGLGIKMALVPLHGWLPDAYVYAPQSVSPLLAALVTKVALYAVVRLLYWVVSEQVIGQELPLLLLSSWLGAVATVVGAFLALSQQDLRRMFAYAGISHIGLIVMGVCVDNPTGFAGGIFYLINDAIMQAALFAIAGMVMYSHGICEIADLSRIRGHMPWTLTALIVIAVSMIGIPPSGGFFGKWYIILGALEASNYLVVAAVVGATLLTLGYFVKIFERIFGEREPIRGGVQAEGPLPMRVSIGVLAGSTLLLGILSDSVIRLILDHALPR
ncbi:MAG: hydrogenase 4 subunit B [Nitrospirae bacterium]|nr:MAG: hydrogenase 4 subunit B [Nitrospirota bacterium]